MSDERIEPSPVSDVLETTPTEHRDDVLDLDEPTTAARSSPYAIFISQGRLGGVGVCRGARILSALAIVVVVLSIAEQVFTSVDTGTIEIGDEVPPPAVPADPAP